MFRYQILGESVTNKKISRYYFFEIYEGRFVMSIIIRIFVTVYNLLG